MSESKNLTTIFEKAGAFILLVTGFFITFSNHKRVGIALISIGVAFTFLAFHIEIQNEKNRKLKYFSYTVGIFAFLVLFYLFINVSNDAPKPELVVTDKHLTHPSLGDRIEASITIKNTGQVTAEDIRDSIYVKIFEKGIEPKIPKSVRIDHSRICGAGLPITLPAISQKSMPLDTPEKTYLQYVDEMGAGKHIVFVYGLITYKDSDKNNHCIRFCFEYDYNKQILNEYKKFNDKNCKNVRYQEMDN